MDPNRLTQKSQQALHDAQTKALRYGHTEVDSEHVLLALLDDPDGLIPRLLMRTDLDADSMRRALERHLEGRPRTSGSRSTAATSSSRRASAASTPSSAATRRSAGSSRSSHGRPRTTPC